MASTPVDFVALKHSATPGDTPDPAELEAGELAVNTSDLKLFVKDAAGNVRELGSTGGKIHNSTVAPANPGRGDVWIDTSGTDPQLKIYSGATWVPAMPLDGITVDANGAGGAVQVTRLDAGVMA